MDPSVGTVGFGSGLHSWAFTLKQFAEIYSDKFKIEPSKLMKRLWGDQFFNAKERKWNKTGGEGYVRGFCQFILDPIYKVFDAVMNFRKEETEKLLAKLNVKLDATERVRVPLYKFVFWLMVSSMITVAVVSLVYIAKHTQTLHFLSP